MGKNLVVNPDKCTGCRTCEMACSYKWAEDFNPRNAAISIMIDDEVPFAVPVMCPQCENSCCIKACPVDALYWDDKAIKCDWDKCTLCGICVSECSLKCINISPTMDKIIKCDLCGGDPACVKSCPSGALEWTEGDTKSSQKAVMANAVKAVYGKEAKK